VGVVRTEEHVLGAQDLDEVDDVVLGERAHPEVLREDLARLVREGAAEHRPAAAERGGLVDRLEQGPHPAAAVLDRDDPDAGMAAEQVVERERGEGVDDGPLGVAERPLQGRLAVRRVRRVLGPERAVGEVVPAVRDVEDHAHVRLDERGPERIEPRVRRRAAAHRARPQVHDLGARVDHPAQLDQRLIEVEQRQHRHREDPAVGAVAPFLLEPPVEGPEAGVGEPDVVDQVLLDGHGEGGEHEGRLDALLVHQRDPRGRIGERRVVLGVDDLAVGEAVGDLAHEQALQRARRRRVVTRHDAHERAAVAHEHSAQPVLAPLDADGRILVARLDVAREAVVGLVVVPVGIDQLVVHRRPRRDRARWK
jgi:hypothetical protein